MSEITARDLVQTVSAIVVLVFLALTIYLCFARPRYRLYMVPALLVLLHSAAYLVTLTGNNFGLIDPPGRLLMDWVVIVQLHLYLTLGIYIVWMPLIRR